MANSQKSLIQVNVRIICAQLSIELQNILNKYEKKTRRRWVRKWILRCDTFGASDHLFKELSTEDSYINTIYIP